MDQSRQEHQQDGAGQQPPKQRGWNVLPDLRAQDINPMAPEIQENNPWGWGRVCHPHLWQGQPGDKHAANSTAARVVCARCSSPGSVGTVARLERIWKLVLLWNINHVQYHAFGHAAFSWYFSPLSWALRYNLFSLMRDELSSIIDKNVREVSTSWDFRLSWRVKNPIWLYRRPRIQVRFSKKPTTGRTSCIQKNNRSMLCN